MKKLVSLFLSFIFLLMPLLLTGCKRGENPSPKSEIYYLYFDTECVITDYAGLTDKEFDRMCDIVEEELALYDSLLDIYSSRAGVTNLKDVNDAAGTTVKVCPELCDFLLYAEEMYDLTGGQVNVALGSVLSLWHAEREAAKLPGAEPKLPDEEALYEAVLHTDIENLIVDKAASTVRLGDPNMRLDVGALGKGYAAKKILERLEEAGFSRFILNLGGNVSASGVKPNGDKFVAGIKNPEPQSSLDRYTARLELCDKSLSTSGDYERFYTVLGIEYHHIIDPDTLFPSVGFRSVTVLGADPSVTDALSTALFTMSIESGRALAKELGVSVYWILDDGSLEHTSGFKFVK